MPKSSGVLLLVATARVDGYLGALQPQVIETSSVNVQALMNENTQLKQRLKQLEPQKSNSPMHRNHGNVSTVLDRGRLEAIGGQNRQVILTFVNKARLDFATTWAAHVRRLGLTNWMIGATDSTALNHLLDGGIPCFDLHTSGLPEGEWAWGGKSFHELGPTKVHLIRQVLTWGLELVLTDVDALVLREPFGFMARYPDASYLTTTDQLANTTADEEGLERHAGAAYNIGYLFFRPSALPLVDEWSRAVDKNPAGSWDQGVFNELAKKNQRSATKPLSSDRLFPSFDGKVIGGVLPLALFCGGHSYFVAQMPQRKGIRPFSVHTTFQYGGADGKRWRLREAMLWEDEPSYYDPLGGLLRYEPDVPSSLLHPRGGMHAKDHIALVEHQLAQLGSAFALARALGRKLILPPLFCGFDKAWYGLDSSGAFSGAPRWIVPISHCPLDHVLEPAQLRPERTVREYSFLSNLRTPAAVLGSQASTSLDVGHAKAELPRLAREFADAKVLTIDNLASTLIETGSDLYALGVLSEQTAKQLEGEGFHTVGGSWCCKPANDPGPTSHAFRLPLLPAQHAATMLHASHAWRRPTEATAGGGLLGWLEAVSPFGS